MIPALTEEQFSILLFSIKIVNKTTASSGVAGGKIGARALGAVLGGASTVNTLFAIIYNAKMAIF